MCLTSPDSACLTSTVQVNSEASSRVTLACIILKLSGFLAGERVIRTPEDRWLVESSLKEAWDIPPSLFWRQEVKIQPFNAVLNLTLSFRFTCLGDESAEASRLDHCGSPGSVAMVLHQCSRREVNDEIILQECGKSQLIYYYVLKAVRQQMCKSQPSSD